MTNFQKNNPMKKEAKQWFLILSNLKTWIETGNLYEHTKSAIMKHSTNYYNTFIEIAEDCKTSQGELPPIKGDKKTVANLQFDMLYEKPYEFTSDEVLFGVFAIRKEFTKGELDEERGTLFLKRTTLFSCFSIDKILWLGYT